MCAKEEMHLDFVLVIQRKGEQYKKMAALSIHLSSHMSWFIDILCDEDILTSQGQIF